MNLPLLCSCAPAKILMNVDLPAPLSPRTQVPSPARTDVVLLRSAMTLPYDFPTSTTSMIVSPLPGSFGADVAGGGHVVVRRLHNNIGPAHGCVAAAGGHLTASALAFTRLLTSTAPSSITPRNAYSQSLCASDDHMFLLCRRCLTAERCPSGQCAVGKLSCARCSSLTCGQRVVTTFAWV